MVFESIPGSLYASSPPSDPRISNGMVELASYCVNLDSLLTRYGSRGSCLIAETFASKGYVQKSTLLSDWIVFLHDIIDVFETSLRRFLCFSICFLFLVEYRWGHLNLHNRPGVFRSHGII
jgi:hypothetical protein